MHPKNLSMHLPLGLAAPNGSRRLTPNGLYTLRCESCGFTFSVGTVRKREGTGAS